MTKVGIAIERSRLSTHFPSKTSYTLYKLELTEIEHVDGRECTAAEPARNWASRCGPVCKELQRYLARRLHDPRNARDLAQEVYLRLLRVGKEELARERPRYLYWVARTSL